MLINQEYLQILKDTNAYNTINEALDEIKQTQKVLEELAQVSVRQTFFNQIKLEMEAHGFEPHLLPIDNFLTTNFVETCNVVWIIEDKSWSYYIGLEFPENQKASIIVHKFNNFKLTISYVDKYHSFKNFYDSYLNK